MAHPENARPTASLRFPRPVACALAAFLGATLCAPPAARAAEGSEFFKPDGFFLQYGAASSSTHSVMAGFAWDWGWRRHTSYGSFAGYWEASLGRWRTTLAGQADADWVTQFGLTPVVRFATADKGPAWFAELGVGVNFISPKYHSDDKQFSTVFNFGDHIALGRRFGSDGANEVSLRLEHFSNAGIDHPNPGQNFWQARYLHRF
jgi:hypothetical protein